MENMQVDAQDAFQAYQRITSNEFSRLYMEIAGRDSLIEKLVARINELEEKSQDGA